MGKLSKEQYFSDDLFNTDWLGEVVDIDDPDFTGKIKVKVFGKFDDLTIEDIPWAYPTNHSTGGSSSGSGFFSVPKLGSIVNIKFDNGNIYFPQYKFVQQISNELKNEISGSYTNAHSLIYDTEAQPGPVKIFFTEKKGIMIFYNDSFINILPEGTLDIRMSKDINILCDGNTSIKVEGDVDANINGNLKTLIKGDATIDANGKVKIDGSTIDLGSKSLEDIIKGNTFQKLFNQHTHLGNLGSATGSPIVPLTGLELSKHNKTE